MGVLFNKVGEFTTIGELYFVAGRSPYVTPDMGGNDCDYRIPKGTKGKVYQNRLTGLIFIRFNRHPMNLTNLLLGDIYIRSNVHYTMTV